MQAEVARQLEIIRRGAAEIIPEEELVQKLEKSLRARKPLKAKLGLDPTAPDIHLGHTVVLNKLRQIQDLGHQVVLIIGDFTGRIGDPSGRSDTRKQLSEAEVLANAETYKEQIFKVLDPNRTEIVFNSTWLGPMNFAQVVELGAKYTLARMLERDDFSKRFKQGLPISIHELFYPLMQGFDSVQLKADLELGGTDQKFNLLVGRVLQREYGQEPQIALTMPILEGLDGVQKMSKSLGNYVGINEDPREIYGKLMSLPDELMLRYFELVTRVPLEEIRQIAQGLEKEELHPRDVKMRLASEVVTMYHGIEAALAAKEEFCKVFQRGELPDEIPEIQLARSDIQDNKIWLCRLLLLLKLVPSTSEARRLVTQGGVQIDGQKIDDPNANILVTDGMVVRAGRRRFARAKLVG
ncbi:MAG: tyrosine--tRNA ligase [Syntrophomonadaceae bacterium]|nr:tyrosine--tRNA ligase [Syntrophomonadaceae bacterium]